MLVLDEQLLGRDLESALARWYRGTVLFITDLRPGAVIKDDAIPVLLRQQRQPTFLTINESDFWRKVAIDAHFCVVCFALPDSRAGEIPNAHAHQSASQRHRSNLQSKIYNLKWYHTPHAAPQAHPAPFALCTWTRHYREP